MGHAVHGDGVYARLQKRLDRTLTGAPASPTFLRILKLLYSPEEADIARRLPIRPTPLPALARGLDRPAAQLEPALDRMARRGLVLDLSRGETRCYALSPVVIGFYEFTFMRARGDLPMAELARLFDRYMQEDDRFERSVFQGRTQVGRALVREEALPQGDFTEVLDWERAGAIIRSAAALSVSLCACRHKAGHLGEACGRPRENCLSMNLGAEVLLRAGIGRRIDAAEALALLAQAKEHGLVQVGDNVQRRPTYICNCCGCCCGMIQAIRTFNLRSAIVTSNWVMEIDPAKCRGCGRCVRACPVGAIRLVAEAAGGRGRAELEPGLCLGCGVCHSACAGGGVTFRPRARRVYTPETIYDRIVAMAIERGKLADVIFEQPQALGPRALKRILWIVEHSPPFRAAMAIAPLRSALLDRAVRLARARVSIGAKPRQRSSPCRRAASPANKKAAPERRRLLTSSAAFRPHQPQA